MTREWTALAVEPVMDRPSRYSRFPPRSPDVFKATPLISKKIWLLISGVILSLFFIPFKPTENSITNKIPEIDLSFLNKIQIPNLFESFSISNTVLYVVLFFGLMIIAQIAFLKNHFDKKFQ